MGMEEMWDLTLFITFWVRINDTSADLLFEISGKNNQLHKYD